MDLGDLVAFYREAKQRFDSDEVFQSSSREEVVKLQGGDPISLKAWGLLCDQSRREFQKIYDRLNIQLSERGESFYNPRLQAVVADLDKSGLLVSDDGARCVFLEGVTGKEGKPMPLIVQKSDGGFNYATTDLAAIRYRLGPDGDGAGRALRASLAIRSLWPLAKPGRASRNTARLASSRSCWIHSSSSNPLPLPASLRGSSALRASSTVAITALPLGPDPRQHAPGARAAPLTAAYSPLSMDPAS